MFFVFFVEEPAGPHSVHASFLFFECLEHWVGHDHNQRRPQC